MALDRQPQARHLGQHRAVAGRDQADLARADRAPAGVDADDAPALAADPGDLAVLDDVDAEAVGGARQAPGDRIVPGTVLLAGSDRHLALQPDLTLNYTRYPVDCAYQPSIDVFFQSLARYWPDRGVAALLTGMGRDGALGMKELRSQNWHTIAQEKNSCVVYGMPKAAVAIDAVAEVLPPEGIAHSFIKRSLVNSRSNFG